MHRLLVASETLNEASPSLPMEAARHLKVLRPKEGELVELFDGRGRARTYCWQACALAADSPVRLFAKPPVALTLFACVTKGSRWDWTIEKATELGVARIVPVISDRTIVRLPPEERPAKRARWQRIAEDAARQSDAKWLPEVLSAVDFREALPLVCETACFIGALTDPPPPPLAAAVSAHLAAHAGSEVGGRPAFAVFIGPEGDLTPDELAALIAIAHPTSFGPTILRAETAALFALSVLTALTAADGSPITRCAGSLGLSFL